MHLHITLIFFAFAVGCLAFNIPLPFSNLSFEKRKDGKTDVNLEQNLNFGGFGTSGNTGFTVGNGTFVVNNTQNALVNGSTVGGGGVFGVDKETGITVDNHLQLGNETVEGGLGKEANFITQLVEAIKKLKKKKD